ncbi:MAG TPA: hotdog fold thioesterase [Spirochaetes bacterium]|nr:hotdog fold thioesterase [Spirochaetota bacterium]
MKEFTAKVENDPYMKFLGITVEKVERGYALCSLRVTPEMLNFLGLLHGGLVFSLADAAFSAASNSDHTPSYALDVSGTFLKTAAVGDTITSEAKLVHTTKRTGLYRMDVRNRGELMATFNGTVFRKA